MRLTCIRYCRCAAPRSLTCSSPSSTISPPCWSPTAGQSMRYHRSCITPILPFDFQSDACCLQRRYLGGRGQHDVASVVVHHAVRGGEVVLCVSKPTPRGERKESRPTDVLDFSSHVVSVSLHTSSIDGSGTQLQRCL